MCSRYWGGLFLAAEGEIGHGHGHGHDRRRFDPGAWVIGLSGHIGDRSVRAHG